MNNSLNPVAQVVTISRGISAVSGKEQIDPYHRDLVMSLKNKRILSARVCGAEKVNGDFFLVVFYGQYKVRIPFEKSAIDIPNENSTAYGRKELIRRILEGRIGSEVEFVISEMESENAVIYADREYAMKIRRDDYFSKLRPDGTFLLEKGVKVEARILHVAARSMSVEVFGKEVIISSGYLRPWPVYDARRYYRNGETVLASITDIQRQEDDIKLSLSVKDALDFNMDEIVSSYEKNSVYSGIVIWAGNNKYMVCLNENIGCLCTKGCRDYPSPGQRVIVKVIGINKDENRIWGTIVDVAN